MEEFLKSLFLDMFGDPVRNEKGWDRTPFSEIGQFLSGGTPDKARDDFWNGEFPWVSPKDMKSSYIADTKDHISEIVFSETPLKRIRSGSLLIVVRGMILAHSFPVAINTVPVAINQDMKAILPNAANNASYLMTCLNSMSRQILTMITSAGHGTKRFDSLAMNRLLLPTPPLDLQNHFATIVDKVEAVRMLYRQNLSELENLCGALSQKAFSGALDLSRIPLERVAEEAALSTATEPDDRLAKGEPRAMSDPSARERLLRQLFDSFMDEHKEAAFSLEEFWNQVEAVAAGRMDEESPPLGVADYDKVRAWLFQSLKGGQGRQHFNEEKNRLELVIRG